MKKYLIILGTLVLVILHFATTQGAGPTPLAPILGGTGISTTTAGNVGNNLYVISVNASGVPVYSFQANGGGGGGSGSATGTITGIAIFSATNTVTSSASLTFTSSTGVFLSVQTSTFTGNVRIGTTSRDNLIDTEARASLLHIATSTRILSVLNNGNVNIGTANYDGSDYVLSVGSDIVRTTQASYAVINVGPTITQAINTGSPIILMDFAAAVNGTGSITDSLIGIRANPSYSGTGRVVNFSAVFSQPTMSGQGTSTYGYYLNPLITGANAKVLNSYGVYVLSDVSFSGNATNSFGIYVDKPLLTGGAINNNYGLVIDTQNVGTGLNYQFYSSSSNPFVIQAANGFVGVNTANPFSMFQVSGLPPQSSTSTLTLLGSNFITGGNVSGTFLGANPSTGYNGDFINFQVNSSTKFSISSIGLASTTELRTPSGTIGTLFDSQGNKYSTSTGANPTANITATVTNGTANTFLRSDAAPACPTCNFSTSTGAFGYQFATSTTGAITAGVTSSAPWVAPFSGTIIGWHFTSNVACSSTIDVWKLASAVPTSSASSIVSSAPPKLAGQQLVISATTTGWTTSFAQNDVFMMQATSTQTCSSALLTLKYQKL